MWLGFVMGVFFGASLGVLGAAICAAGGRADEEAERMMRELRQLPFTPWDEVGRETAGTECTDAYDFYLARGHQN